MTKVKICICGEVMIPFPYGQIIMNRNRHLGDNTFHIHAQEYYCPKCKTIDTFYIHIMDNRKIAKKSFDDFMGNDMVG